MKNAFWLVLVACLSCVFGGGCATRQAVRTVSAARAQVAEVRRAVAVVRNRVDAAATHVEKAEAIAKAVEEKAPVELKQDVADLQVEIAAAKVELAAAKPAITATDTEAVKADTTMGQAEKQVAGLADNLAKTKKRYHSLKWGVCGLAGSLLAYLAFRLLIFLPLLYRAGASAAAFCAVFGGLWFWL